MLPALCDPPSLGQAPVVCAEMPVADRLRAGKADQLRAGKADRLGAGKVDRLRAGKVDRL